MAYSLAAKVTLMFLVMINLSGMSLASRKLTALYQPASSDLLAYHNGAVLQGDISISVMWYGAFAPAQKSIIIDFLLSLSPSPQLHLKISSPSLPEWWNSVYQLYLSEARHSNKMANILLASQVSDANYSIGKSLKMSDVTQLAAKTGPKKGSVALVFSSEDVTVEGFCQSRCGFHGSDKTASVYIWVGNSATQCPGQCAWPFHQPLYGPQTPPLVAPNGDVGVDGMVISLATLLAGAVTNPHGDGFFQGPKGAPLEAATACPGMYAKGAYPGYAGDLLVDPTNGASYNANGAHGRKYMVPALFDPSKSTCSTLV